MTRPLSIDKKVDLGLKERSIFASLGTGQPEWSHEDSFGFRPHFSRVGFAYFLAGRPGPRAQSCGSSPELRITYWTFQRTAVLDALKNI
ncbi:hypothetical protein AVEN_102089-1 [Araneus ventricosus]|uniref:Uncharacterized protein n=1 Tax=Araneus ventricosus TaxID=182803 RepID=A0A4Y2LME3_ARAVE|nr:hypothetical protein AVEN_102089-1 [Araneus ventricosus]